MFIEPLKHFAALLVTEIGEGGDGYSAILLERLQRRSPGRRMQRWLTLKQVHFHLHQLERKGIVRSYGPPGQPVYAITCLGWAALAVVRGQVFPVVDDTAVREAVGRTIHVRHGVGI
jgi:hypothetical protein